MVCRKMNDYREFGCVQYSSRYPKLPLTSKEKAKMAASGKQMIIADSSAAWTISDERERVVIDRASLNAPRLHF